MRRRYGVKDEGSQVLKIPGRRSLIEVREHVPWCQTAALVPEAGVVRFRCVEFPPR